MEKQDQDFYEAGKSGVSVKAFPSRRAQDFYEAGRLGISMRATGEAEQPSQTGSAESMMNAIQAASQTVSDTTQEEVGTLRSLMTGEGRTEYPDMPESADIPDVPLSTAFPLSMKMLLTMDPLEKARVAQKHLEGNPDFGGVYEDAFGNPIIQWQGKGYYINRPGASATDAADIIGQGAQFLPAARVASGANTIGGRAITGLATYGATDAAQQAGTVLAGGKDAIDAGQAGTSGLIGGSVEALAPPLMKGAARVTRGAIDAGRKALFPRYVPPTDPSAVLRNAPRIPKTQGQRSQNINMIRREEAARQGGYGETASDIMRSFDERQLDAIRTEADALQPGRSGYGTSSPTDIGTRIQGDLIDEAARRKSAVNDAYKAAETASREAPATMSPEGVTGLARDVLSIPRTMGIVPEQAARMPNLQSALNIARNVLKQSQKPGFKPQSFQRLEGARQALGNLWKSTTDETEKEALRQIRSKVDAWTDKAITDGLMSGDPGTIDAIRNARNLAREYFQNFGKGQGLDPAGSAMVRLLDENKATPLDVVNWLTGAAQTRSTAKAVGLVKRIQNVFGPDSEQVAILKDAFLMRAFTGVSRGERSITQGSLVKGGRNLIDGDGKQIAELLFSPDEIKRIRGLIDETATTITPQDARNPSRSSFAILQLLRDNNLLSIAGKTIRAVPFLSEAGTIAKDVGGAVTARNLVSQTERLMSAPLVSSGGAAAALGYWNARQRERGRLNEAPRIPPTGNQESALPSIQQNQMLADALRRAPRLADQSAGGMPSPGLLPPPTRQKMAGLLMQG